MLSLLLAVAGVALMGLFPARPAWLINAWSLQYAHHALNPTPSRATWKSDGPNCAANRRLWIRYNITTQGRATHHSDQRILNG